MSSLAYQYETNETNGIAKYNFSPINMNTFPF
jgi:hypothetical protein